MSRCERCRTENIPGVSFCRMCGNRLPAANASGVPGPRGDGPPLVADGQRLIAPAPPARHGFRLTLLNSDGSPRIIHEIQTESVDIGRTEGELLLDDPQLASRHARIVTTGGVLMLVPIDHRNGVYVRVRASTELGDGDYFLVGKQVLQFEVVSTAERGVPPALENGVRFFGTPGRSAWGRLRQRIAAGVTRDVYHLERTDVVIGREKADLVFSDDESMSRQHARLSLRNGHVLLEDLGSSNGSFFRLYGPHRLTTGDVLRLGDQVFLFEGG